jgi:molybdopterin converting factor small subunit
MSAYLSEIDAYDPTEFGDNVQALIQAAISKCQLKDLFDENSDFYPDLTQEIADILYEFCDQVADEAWDMGEESGRESGYEAGYEYARDEYDSTSEIENLEETISELESDLQSKREELEELQTELDECRQSPVLPEVDIDDLREAIRADLMAEMSNDDEDDY